MRKGTRMKSRFAKARFALAAALLFVVAPARATTSVTMDGVWWQELPPNVKVYVVQGMITGLAEGHNSGWADGEKYVRDTYITSSQQRLAILQKETKKLMAGTNAEAANAPVFSKTFGTYIDELDTWYQAHPKRTIIRPIVLLDQCFADNATLPAIGLSCDDLGKDFDK